MSPDVRSWHQMRPPTMSAHPKATLRVRGRVLAPFGGALPEASASFARSGSPVIIVNPGFIGGVRVALHVLAEGSELRHDWPAAGIVEKHTRQHRCERLQHVNQFSRSYWFSGDRLRHLRKTHTFDSRAKHGRKVVGDKRARYGNLDRAAVVVERP